MTSAAINEIETNYSFFQGVVGSLLPNHYGEYALLRARQVVGLFPSAAAALTEAQQFTDGVFSVQKIIDRPLDLGFLSYASNERITA